MDCLHTQSFLPHPGNRLQKNKHLFLSSEDKIPVDLHHLQQNNPLEYPL